MYKIGYLLVNPKYIGRAEIVFKEDKNKWAIYLVFINHSQYGDDKYVYFDSKEEAIREYNDLYLSMII